MGIITRNTDFSKKKLCVYVLANKPGDEINHLNYLSQNNKINDDLT